VFAGVSSSLMRMAFANLEKPMVKNLLIIVRAFCSLAFSALSCCSE